ncbi:glucokinase [Nitratireductor sp. L1-7-SE]|uniref:Glucokinase n=1 Tax=Nitratireductor rhodophyticola TaxID=2854036 RepID=A0ABS7R947_9HYPH|nr:glucokinase [Nitratireductor rhodophyticola]MBY8916521.1 glucokinase [Nitratireductor rhodophyticola]MBY8921885.1 glucokinase [Nitratireductor rhodophyticola]
MHFKNENDTALRFPVLIGDIGGTNARFAILVDSNAEPKAFPVVQTADYATIDEAIQSAILDRTSIIPQSAVLAVAGPVEGDEIDLTNCDWVVRPRKMMETMGFSDIIVINDFEAQALAVVALDDDNLEMVCPGTSQPTGSRVVLGPGTGLGMAGLVHAQHTWFPVPGEGGHVDLGPRTGRDLEIFPHLERIEGRVAAEQILCGRGMVNLYRAINAADGTKPVHETPAEISSAGLDGSDPVAMETLDLFVTYLGRLAGDMALIFMARGGVYLSGGIAQKIVPTLKNGHFRAAFEDKAPHSALVKDIPVYVITHPKAALVGLAAYARTPVRFGIETQGRRWKAA